MVKVYVLETGVYDGCYVFGVYSSPEAAMARHSPQRPPVVPTRYGVYKYEHQYEWKGPDQNGFYHFDADWEDHATITVYELDV